MAGAPTPPISLAAPDGGVRSHIPATRVEVPDAVIARLESVCASVSTEPATLGEASRDWWPLAMTWALHGEVGGLAASVARPGGPAEVAAVLAVCSEAGVPVTAAGGRSGVCGGSVPVHGGVVIDLCGLAGVRDLDAESNILDVAAGTFGDVLEAELREEHQRTLGHWPQSIALSTVGGWLACRSAGQLSNRYGKIEDMVVGLTVALADGRLVQTGGSPRAAVGPDLNQVFVGSEGTLGVITDTRLRLHPAPPAEARSAWAFRSFTDGLDACRRIIQRGAPVAVLRLYDAVEADRGYQTGDRHLLLALDEGDPAVVEASMAVVADECRSASAEEMDPALVESWLEHRNDVSALEALIERELVVDTMEIAGRWSALATIYDRTIAAISEVEGTLVASAHQSHAYPDGACLYFTFAGRPGDEAAAKDAYYRAVWDAGTQSVLAAGGALSHHHGVGLNRARFVRDALGTGYDVLVSLKEALDPAGVLNPGKLGLPSPFGEVSWP